MTHKPLSSWIATIDLAQAPIRWGPHIRTNDGDGRSDARKWPRFEDPAWQRVSVPVVIDGELEQGLGLRYDDTQEAVVELDDYSRPILVGQQVLAVLSRIETEWPHATISASDRERLTAASMTLRHALVDRLAAESTPDPQVFWLLPWDVLDAFCSSLYDALRGIAHRDPPRPQHWFTPIGALITPALEQLYQGLVTGDHAAARLGGTAFCACLLDLDIGRVPETSRRRLAEIALVLAAQDPLLRHTGRRMAERLNAEEEHDSVMRLSARLQPAAASTTDSSYTASLEADPFKVTAIVRAGGRLTIVVAAQLTDAEYDSAVQRYGAVIVALSLSSGGVQSLFYIPVGRTPSGFSGLLRTRIHDEIVDLSAAAPPIGVAEILSRPMDEVSPSLAELDRAGTLAWMAVAQAAPVGHPLRSAIEVWQERYGL